MHTVFFFLMIQRPPRSKLPDTPFPDTTLFRSELVFVSGAQAHRFDLAVGLDAETRARDPAHRPQHRFVTGHDHRHALADLQRVRPLAADAGQRDVAKRDVEPAQPLAGERSEEHTSELQSLMRISYDVFCLKKQKKYNS